MHQRLRNGIPAHLKRFRRLARRITRTRHDSARLQALGAELRTLYRRLRPVCSARRLRRMAGAAAVLAGLHVAAPVQAQTLNLAEPVVNPGNLSVFDVASLYYTFFDVDGDGDPDIGSTTIDTLENGVVSPMLIFRFNSGTAAEPDFEGDVGFVPLEGINIDTFDLGSPEFADIDNDGDLDLFVGSYDISGFSAPVFFYENTGDDFGPLQVNPFGLSLGETDTFEPTLVDIDGDGDLDLFTLFYGPEGENADALVFLENTGTATEPAFGEPVVNPFGINPGILFPLHDFADLDEDGDYDLVIAGYNPEDDLNVAYLENTGTATNPAFSAPNTTALGLDPIATGFALPEFVDWDNDGDDDLIVFGELNEEQTETIFLLVENLAMVVGTKDPTLAGTVQLYPTLASDQVTLEVQPETLQAYFDLRLVDATGRVHYTRRFDGGGELRQTLPVANLPAGTYYLHLRTPQGVAVKTFIKQ